MNAPPHLGLRLHEDVHAGGSEPSLKNLGLLKQAQEQVLLIFFISAHLKTLWIMQDTHPQVTALSFWLAKYLSSYLAM